MSSLAATAFALGLLGGVHCIGMCGGIVAALNLRPDRPAGRVSWSIQLGYNAGRIASYALAGAAAGMVGSLGTLLDRVLPLQIALYVLANVLLVLLGFYLAGYGTAVLRLEAAGGAVWRYARSRGIDLRPAQTPRGAIAAGMVWGWIPCGLVYSALALALLSGGPGAGALVMGAFGLGTLPNLLASGALAAKLRFWVRNRRWRVAAGAAVVLMGLVGLARAPGVAEHVRQALLCIV
jgi:sulfite exporter TauE/SafE